MESNTSWRESAITRAIQVAGFSAIGIVLLIFFFLLREGLPALREVSVIAMLTTRWYPTEDYYGILPLLTGSLIVTLGAAMVAVPFGLGTAIFIAEIAPRWMREMLKPIVELLGGLPSVMLGFLGIIIFAPYIRILLELPTGLSALTGSLLLGAIAIPTVVSVAEDSLDTVPRAYREGAWALGATQWQTIWRVTLPAARSGVLTAVMLGIGRAIGETMTVMMVTGNAPVMAVYLGALISPVRTMTATIAAEMGEVATGSIHYHVLFFIGIVLFFVSLVVNITASAIIFRQRKRSERILS
jgi:phosphate transport system permease protein